MPRTLALSPGDAGGVAVPDGAGLSTGNWQGRPGQPGTGRPAAGLLLAAAIYGIAGAPAPASPGLAEAAVALCLVLAVGIARPLLLGSSALLRAPGLRPVDAAACLLLIVAVWPGMLTGAAHGWDFQDIARDLLPFGFLLLPVLIRPPDPTASLRLARTAAWGLAAVGLLYALRWWIDLGLSLRIVGAAALVEQPPFLLKSAALPFAAVWLVAQGAARVGWHRTVPAFAAGILLILAGLLCLASLAAAVHRAALILAAAALLVVLVRRLGNAAGPWLAALTLAAAGALLWDEVVGGSLRLLVEKTQAVGINNRAAEFWAVLAQVGAGPLDVLFGHGWGALVRSPAAGEVPISYTHNLGSYMLLKTGVVGLIAMLLYMAAILSGLGRVWRRDPHLVLAALPPLVIGLLLHTSYKYLCFGLLLLLLTLAAEEGER